MKYITFISVILALSVSAEELKVKSNSFSADENKGISIFKGDVNIQKANDELNASKVTIYTDKNNQPTKFISEGNSSFKILTEEGVNYRGTANKVIYYPSKKEYRFYGNAHLIQIGEKKEILGEEIVLSTMDGKAYAKSSKTEPVIMIFDIKDETEKND